nr:hypothetical protein [Campylobacter lari]
MLFSCTLKKLANFGLPFLVKPLYLKVMIAPTGGGFKRSLSLKPEPI